jgi:hypothetical protein
MTKQNNSQAKAYYYDLHGKRQEKYDFLNDNFLKSINWKELENRKPEFFFVKKDWEVADKYKKGFSVKILYKESENMRIGLILCATASREQIELLEMHKDGIMVAEYWKYLPPKEKSEEKLHNILIEAKERMEIKKIEEGK